MKSIYQSMIAPTEMRKHLILNQYRLFTADDVATEIEEYCDALDEAEQSTLAASSSSVAPIAPNGRAKEKEKATRAQASPRATTRAKASCIEA